MSIYSAVRRWFVDAPHMLSSPPVMGTGNKTECDMRADAESILRSAVIAVDPQPLVARAMRAHEGRLTSEGRVWIAGFGKAVVGMARGVHEVLGDRIEHGVLIAPPGTVGYVSPQFDIFRGGYPVPDQASVAGSRAIRQMAQESEESDLLICLISGGGSALLTLPPDDLPLEDVQRITSLLLDSGARIEELNCVRKHLDALKGGQLARAAAPGRVLAFVLSDVVGDPLDVIASGPVAPDPTCFSDAVATLRRHGLWSQLPLAARGYLDRGVCGEIEDTPDVGDPLFLRTTCEVIGNGRTAAVAACAEAERRGYQAQVLTTTLSGEAREAGRFLAETAKTLRDARSAQRTPTCLVTAGETSVGVRGPGRGGRNQELTLGAAIALDAVPAVLVASMGSDGVDGPTDAAGALATGTTVERARRAGFDSPQMLRGSDAYAMFAALDDLIVSGPTGTNVADIQVLLVD